ncbi:MAG: stalk domain-containing protein, partial [Firmicutes bacterium]|nr:stalk domain-containing protein [Bacillota bacterium]
DAKKNAGVYFTYDVITTTEYTSVVIHTSVNPGNTSSDRVTTFVLNTTASDGGEKYRIYTLEDLLGPNAYKLANSAISKGIAAADPGSYFTGGDGFDGLYSDPSFYVDQDGNAVIIFDKYSIAPGVMGTPAFAIPLGNVVNIAFDAADTLTVDGAALVPLRRVAEALGYAVAWDGGSQTVTMTKGDKASAVKIGDAAFNGGDLTAAPVIHNGLTYIPVAFAELGLGGCYQVNPKTGGVTVSAVR